MLGIKESTRVNAIIVLIKVSVVIVFICLGLFYIQPENYTPFIPPNKGLFGEFGWSGIMRAAGVIFFAYVGFDSVSMASQETLNPKKNVPLGILGSLAICTLLYMAFSFVLVGLVPYTQLNVAAPIALAISKTPFWWISQLIKLAIIAGFTSVILVMLLGQSRLFFAMSRDKLLPACFSDIHPIWRTPWQSNLILLVFVGLFGAFAPLSLVGHMTSIGTLLAFIIVCSSVMILRYTNPHHSRPFKVPFYPLTPLLGIMMCFAMMVSLGKDTWLRLLIWMGIGIAIYFIYSQNKLKGITPK